jgi:hypothetical protein
MTPPDPPAVPATFAQWLRPKRKVYTRLVAATFVVAVVAAALLLAVRLDAASLATRRGMDPASAPSWWFCFAPLAVPAGVALVALLFEALSYRLRLDPHDAAWHSLAWLVRAWRGWRWWLPFFLVAFAVSAWLETETVVVLSIQLLALNARNVVPERVLAAWRMGWPGARTVWVLAVLFAVFGLVAFALKDVELSNNLLIAIFLPAWIASLVIDAAVATLWLNQGRLSLREAFVRTARWRVMLPIVLQGARLYVVVLLACAPLLSVGMALAFGMPPLEELLFYCCDARDRWAWLVGASRFTVSWWWAALMMFVGLLVPVLDFVTIGGRGRLLVQLGLLDEPLPAEVDGEAIAPATR